MHQIRNFYAPFDSESFWEHYESPVTTIALFLKLAPSPVWANLPVLGFTSHTEDVYLPAHGITFKSSAGLNPSVAEIEGSRPSNLEMVSVFDDQISESDLMAGKWSNARYELWMMNYKALDMGEFVVQSGILTDIKSCQDYFRADVAGESVKLQTKFGVVTSRTCRVKDFGDFECKKNLNTTFQGFAIKKTLTVASVVSQYEIWFNRIDNVADDFYTNGKITGASGANEDIAREMKEALGFGTSYVKVRLKRAFPLTVTAGETFELVAGCDRTLERCRAFGNVINRRAEDFLPGIENISKIVRS